MADTPTGETVTPGDSQTTVPTTSTPSQDNVSAAEVERLRKAAEQAEMRANQLKNELDKKKAEDEAARLKQLEENEEWKQLAEQSKIKLEEFENAREAEQRQATLKTATTEIFSQFPDEVKEIAEETGLTITEDTDEARIALKAKLEKIATKVVKSRDVTPNNPANPAVPQGERTALLQRMGNGDREARAQVIGNLPGVKEMRKIAGLE
jgi:hypothetical protein